MHICMCKYIYIYTHVCIHDTLHTGFVLVPLLNKTSITLRQSTSTCTTINGLSFPKNMNMITALGHQISNPRCSIHGVVTYMTG